MRNKLISLLSVAVLLASLLVEPVLAAGTSGYIATNIPKSFPVEKQDSSATVVNFWHAMTGNNAIFVNNIVNWYNSSLGKKNKVYVKSIFQGAYDAMAVKIQAAIQSNDIKNLPDLAQLNATGAFSVKESKNIIYMEDMIKNDPSFKIKDKLNKNALWSCSYKGKLLGMPFSNSMIAFHYNANAFKSVGLNPDAPPKTLAELAEYAKKLMIKGTGKKPVRYGISHKLNLYAIATWIPRQKNGTAFQFNQEDGRLGIPTKCTSAEDGTLKATLTAWKGVADTGALEYTSSSLQNFEVGAAAMYMESMIQYDTITRYFKTVKDKTKVFENRMARIPSVNADDAIGTAIGGSAVYMFEKNNATKKAATWDFVKFLASTDVSAYWYANSGYFPLNNDALKTKYVTDALEASPQKKVMKQALADSASCYKFQETWIPGISQYSSAVENNFLLIAQGKETVDKALDSITKKASSLLATYWKANS